ncbi:MAG: YceI family protein [Bacteroidota bacterium]
MSVDFALIVLSIVAVLAFFSYLTGRETFLSFFSLLLACGATSLISSELKTDQRTGLLQIMVFVYLLFNFLLSRVEVLRNIKFGVYGTALSSFMLFTVGRASFSLYEFEFSYFSFGIWILPILGTLLYVGSELLSGMFSQFVGFETRSSFQQLSQVFLVSIVAFLGFFFASYFGLFLIGIGYIASSFYREDHTPNIGFSLLTLALVPFISTLVGIDSIDISLGKNLFGLFAGFSGVWFLFILSQSKINPIAFSMFGYILHLIFSVLLLLLGTQKADLGGVEPFLSYLIGSALAFAVYHEFKLTQLVFPSLICAGIYFGPKVNGTSKEAQETTTANATTTSTTKSGKKSKPDPFIVKGLSIDELIGEYEIDDKTSLINFSLGPKGGKTEGEIKNFTGTVKIDEKTGSSTFSVTLPVKNLTTNNDLRDESLMEKAYFNVGKYPKMTYKSKKLTKVDDYYELDGEFTMLGVSKPLKVKVKYTGIIDKEGVKVPVFLGKAAVDRTQFGMSPDSKEGNLVDFDLRIELKKSEKKEEPKKESKKEEKPKKKKKKKENSSRPRRDSD